MSIFGLNFLFKIKFSEYIGEKSRKCFPVGPETSKCPSSTNPPLPWKISGKLHSFVILFCKMLHLKCLTVIWIHLCYGKCSVICTVTLCYVQQQAHLEFWHIQRCDLCRCIYSIKFSVIKAYSHLLRHYWGIFSTLCNPRTYSLPCHIMSPGIFRTEGLFETLWNIDQAYSEPCYRALFTHIQAYSEPCVCRNLAYPESWNIQNPSIASQCIFRTLSYLPKFTNIQNSDVFKLSTYLEPSQRFKMRIFVKVVKNYNYITKVLYHRSLTRQWICLSISSL